MNPLTHGEVTQRLKAAQRAYSRSLLNIALEGILSNWRVYEFEDEDSDTSDPSTGNELCSPEDFFEMDSFAAYCFSRETGTFVGWFLVVNDFAGNPSETFADWTCSQATPGKRDFDAFLTHITEALSDVEACGS